MNITLLSATVSTAPNKSGKAFQTADVAYKNNSYGGKIEGKKITQYSEAAFKVVTDPSSVGKTFEVEIEKKDGFNNWVSMQEAKTVAGPQSVQVGGPSAGAPRAGATAAPRSTYETPEERAKKQVYIVRQSSVSSAIALHSVGAKALDLDKVLETAKKVEAYVLGTGATGFDDFPDVPDEFVNADGTPNIT